MASTQPKILLLSLEKEPWHREMIDPLLSMLKSKSMLIEAESKSAAIEMLTTIPDAVLVVDAGVTKPNNRDFAQKLADYARNGGTVVLGGLMSSFSTPPQFNAMIKDVFRTQWKFGDYTREDSVLNGPALATKLAEPRIVTLPLAINVKAVWLQGTAKTDRVYASSDYGPKDQASVAFTRVERGYLGWIGDVNNEVELIAVYSALLLSPKLAEREGSD